MSDVFEIETPLPLPERHITARALWERVNVDACGLPLQDLLGRVNAYAVHCATGPYLMSVREWDHYVAKCQAAHPQPFLTQP